MVAKPSFSSIDAKPMTESLPATTEEVDAVEREAVSRSGRLRPRYGMKSLWLLMSLLCVLLAMSKVVSFVAFIAGLMLFLCVAAHVAGNALGTRLRDQSQRARAEERPEPPARLEENHFAPTTRLSQRHSLGLIITVVVILSALLGGAGGYWLFSLTLAEKATWANLALGTAASGVLGGFFGFAVSTLLKVIIAANLEAWKDPSRDRASG
jgi:MFS family permease